MHAWRWTTRAVGWYLAGCAVVILAGWLLGATWSERQARRELGRQLEAELATLEAALPAAWNTVDPDQLETLARRLASAARGRVTFLDLAGRVLADSGEGLARGETLSARSEIRAARERGRELSEQAVSWSARPVLTLAARVPSGEAARGLVRLSRPIPTSAQGAGELARWAIAVGGVLALAGLVWVVRRAHDTGQWLDEVESGLIRLARGQDRTSPPATAQESLAAVSTSLTRAADEMARRLAELRQQGERLSTVLGGMIEGVIAVDARENVLLANQAARALLDLHTLDGAGRPLWEVVRNRAVHQAASEALTSSEPCSLEFEVPGKVRRVVSLYATRLPGDPPRGAVLVLHDVTELRRLENLRQEFVANVSHELKTPLTAIKAYAETLRSGAIYDAEHNEMFVRQIEEQAERLHQLILDLLSLARIEAGQELFEIEPLNPAPLVRQCLAQQQAAAAAKHLVLEAVPPAEPLRLLADAEGLREILDNLVDNAVKYTPEGGRVTVAWRLDEGQVQLTVADTGIGIPEHAQARVFERFYRVDKARSRQLGGTGLGLSIVKHLAQACGGRVAVESQVGRGSTFSIWLPAAPGQAAIESKSVTN